MIDVERIEADIVNSTDLLWLHLKRLEASDKKDERLAKTVNIFLARTVGLAKHAKRVRVEFPGLT